MELALIQCRGVVTVFRAELQSGHAAPYDPLFPVSCPSHSFVRGTALTAYQQFCQGVFTGVFPQLCFATLLQYFALAGATRHLVSHLIEHLSGDDGRMVVLHIVHGALALVFLHLLGDAVRDIGLLQQGVSDVFFIRQDVVDDGRRPGVYPLCGRDLVLV